MPSQVLWIVCGRLPLRGYRGPGPVRASAHPSGVLVGAGVTPAVHSHGPAPLAPVVAGDRRCAHDRANFDRAVDGPCSRLIRPQGPQPRTAAWRASLRGYHAVGGQQAARPVGPGALVVRSRPKRPGSTSRTRGSPRGRPTPLPPGQSMCCCTVHIRADTFPFGEWVQTQLPVNAVWCVGGWPVTSDQHAGACAACSVGSGSGRDGPL